MLLHWLALFLKLLVLAVTRVLFRSRLRWRNGGFWGRSWSGIGREFVECWRGILDKSLAHRTEGSAADAEHTEGSFSACESLSRRHVMFVTQCQTNLHMLTFASLVSYQLCNAIGEWYRIRINWQFSHDNRTMGLMTRMPVSQIVPWTNASTSFRGGK